MMEKLPFILTYDDGVGKLFKTCGSHCKWSCAIYLALAWKLTYELLSLQAKTSDALPPPYLYIVKIENFHPILTLSLKVCLVYSVAFTNLQSYDFEISNADALGMDSKHKQPKK